MEKKIVRKKISFIVPKLNEDSEGYIKKSFFKAIAKYSNVYNIETTAKNLLDVEKNGVALMGTPYIVELDDTDIVIYEDTNSLIMYFTPEGNVTLNISPIKEGDKISLIFGIDGDITIEEKVHSSFEGLVNGSVKFKVWRDGDILFKENDDNFIRSFIFGLNHTVNSAFSIGGADGDQVFELNGVEDCFFNISKSDEYVTITGYEPKQIYYDVEVKFGDPNSILLELVVE